MGTDSLQPADDLRLFHTGEHPCGYWPERIARDLVLDPRDPRLAAFYPTALGWVSVAPATWSTGRTAKVAAPAWPCAFRWRISNRIAASGAAPRATPEWKRAWSSPNAPRNIWSFTSSI